MEKRKIGKKEKKETRYIRNGIFKGRIKGEYNKLIFKPDIFISDILYPSILLAWTLIKIEYMAPLPICKRF